MIGAHRVRDYLTARFDTAWDSLHPRWQATSALALKTLKVGIAEISRSDLSSPTSSVLNLVNTHDLDGQTQRG